MSKNSDAAIALLEKHFDIAFAAPDGIKKLRELILSLAMQGKLVAQDPSDQPASELLKEIEEEINLSKLISESKLNRQLNILPKSWRWMRVGDIFELKSGYSFPKEDELQSGQYMYLKVGEMNAKGNEIAITSTSIFLNESPRVVNALIPANSIIFPKRGGAIATNKKRLVIKPICVDTNIMAMICPINVELNFAYNWILSLDLATLNTGTSVPQINNKDINPLLFPLPPLAEQRRIVAKIDELMARCDELERLRGDRDRKQITVHNSALNRLIIAKEQSDFNTAWQFITQHFGELYSVKENVTELRKAILQLAVMGKLVPQDPNEQPASELLKEIEKEKERLVKEGKIKKSQPLPQVTPDEIPYDLPQSWKWARLGNVSISSDSGWSPQCLPEPRSGQEWGVLKVSAVSWGEFRPEENKALPQGIEPKPECEVRAGDFLLSRANTDELVARSVVVKGSPSHLMMSDKIVRFNLSQKNNKNFINYTNLSPFSRNYYACNASGTSSSMKNISREVMNNLPIPIPPLAEQHRIVAKIDQLMALCDNIEKQIDAANSKQTNLLNAVMTKI